MSAEIATTAGEYVSYAWEKNCRGWGVQWAKIPMPGELWHSCLAVSAEIATTAGESVRYTWKRAAVAGEYWSPKYLCLAMSAEMATTAGESVSYTCKRAATAGEY